MKLTTCLAFVLSISGASLGQAQNSGKQQTANVDEAKSQTADPDLTAIRNESKSFVEAFNKHDAEAVAALWSPDGEYTDEAGTTLSGRDAIGKAYTEFFATNPKAKIKITIDSIRKLSDAAAIEEGQTLVEPVAPGATGMAQYTAFHIKVDGKWKMASVRDTEIKAPGASQHLADLDWLIGKWVAEENGVMLESDCRWIANRTFVARRHTATHLDGSKREGLQIIGWNPYAGHIQSWDFSSDGGNAAGVWTPTEAGWTAQMQGVTGDGNVTSAVNDLLRLDGNAYVFRSTDRTRGGIVLPEADELVIRRLLPVE